MKTSSKGKLWQKSLREVELEIRSYKSSLLLVNEEPERGVFLFVIEVRSGDKRLAEVGCTDEDGELQAVGAVLPASKLKGNESTEDAARRLHTWARARPRAWCNDAHLGVGADAVQRCTLEIRGGATWHTWARARPRAGCNDAHLGVGAGAVQRYPC
jgi:hypothetical protein